MKRALKIIQTANVFSLLWTASHIGSAVPGSLPFVIGITGITPESRHDQYNAWRRFE